MATTNSTSQTKIHQYQPLHQMHPIIAKLDRLLDRMESRIDTTDRLVDNLPAPLPAAAPPPVPQSSPSNNLSRTATKLVSCEEKQLGVEGDSDVLNQVDLQLNGMKLVDEEICYETEWIPSSHSSSLDHDLGAHPKMKPNDSLNWRGSFLDVVDESKSSILDDNRVKAIYNDDEFIEMEPQSVRLSDDSDLHWDVVGVSESSSSPSCVDNCSQQKCGDEDEDEDDRVDVLSQHQNLVQRMKVELKSCDIRCLPTIFEDSVTPMMIEDLRPRKSDHMIGYKVLKETEAFTTGKTRADSVLPRFLAGKGHRDLETMYFGQLCLSWEILWRLDAETRKLLNRDGEGRCTYNRTAEELQQFQVLAQRLWVLYQTLTKWGRS
ncbi:hypothetical protein SASPL_148765 [Salvia splendens]|uniref:Uncharacterized protein n=1 Tax=Salvia splendens TaxID=180675 RepID=A0A8X8Z4K9_SALSN|nr:hypothetical protein SASPL_148765 [Salvia splendens]